MGGSEVHRGPAGRVWLDRATGFPGWESAWAVALSAVVLLMATPGYGITRNIWIGPALQWKIEHPLGAIDPDSFRPPGDEPEVRGWIAHLQKRTYRVTAPLLAHALGLDPTGLAVTEQVAAFLFLAGCIRLAARMTGDRTVGVLVGAVHAFSFVGTWGFNDLIFYDTFAYLLLLGCTMSLPAPMYAGAVVLAGFVDERAVLATPLLVAFWACGGRAGPLDPARHRRVRPVVASLAAGVGAYASIRLLMGWSLGLPRADTQYILTWDLVRENLAFSPASVPLLWEFGWLVVLAGLAAAAPVRPAAVAALLAAWGPTALAAFAVVDFSRSAAYSFPAFWVCLRWLDDTGPPARVRAVAAVAAAGNFVCPTVQTMNGVRPFTSFFLS